MDLFLGNSTQASSRKSWGISPTEPAGM